MSSSSHAVCRIRREWGKFLVIAHEATPGPWTESYGDVLSGEIDVVAFNRDWDGRCYCGFVLSTPDAALIAALRNEAEGLLDAADKLDEQASEIARLREQLSPRALGCLASACGWRARW